MKVNSPNYNAYIDEHKKIRKSFQHCTRITGIILSVFTLCAVSLSLAFASQLHENKKINNNVKVPGLIVVQIVVGYLCATITFIFCLINRVLQGLCMPPPAKQDPDDKDCLEVSNLCLIMSGSMTFIFSILSMGLPNSGK